MNLMQGRIPSVIGCVDVRSPVNQITSRIDLIQMLRQIVHCSTAIGIGVVSIHRLQQAVEEVQVNGFLPQAST